MGKHLTSAVRLRRPVDTWHKPALSAAVALAVPDLTLLALGRLDLILYTSAGAMCALYAHGLPYAARARTLLWVVLGMVASLGVALTAASLTTSPALLVAGASLVAAAHKAVCDATRVGPPGNLILTFISSSAFFMPQRLGEVPFHLALALAAGAVAWLVCMAPGLVRPHDPERVAVARALESAAALWRVRRDGTEPRGRPDTARQDAELTVRQATAGAVNSAWHTLFLIPGAGAARHRLEHLLAHAESALAAPSPEARTHEVRPHEGRPHEGRPHEGRPRTPAHEAERCAALARAVRRGGALPEIGPTPDEARRLAGVAVEAGAKAETAAAREAEHTVPEAPRRPAPDRATGGRAVLARLRPGSPLLPIGVRVAVGCTLAGWVSLAAGVGHPYWAVVSAASVHQANTTLSGQRGLQRVLGNVLGLILFFALLPLIRVGPLAMVLLALALQVGAEALITRNYWLGSVCVTPMALLLTEFGGHLPARTLIADRLIDTVVGVTVALACCALVTNRRATDRIDEALARVTAARSAALRHLGDGEGPDRADSRDRADSPDGDHEAGWARDRLALSLVELREAFEVASGEWWQRALPAERVAAAEREGHRTLARLVRRAAPRVPVS
ncbi:FUSC family protein [Streptomyces sp. JV176]|uniref:FUSC family protein n=1 Tax=Streptomyces sp. JV176 TaxID=858630 RepID=UPI002E77E235|nr:FUSC family protein [Streptomyces sp. JV176]MEE1801298.1 FUSC family protein [Streptomyces sp. JV176]